MGRIKLKPCLVGQAIKWGKRMRVTTTTRGRQQRSITHFTRFPGHPIQREGGDHLDGSQTPRRPVNRVLPVLCGLSREFYFVSLYSHSASGPAPRSIPQPIPFRGIDRRIRDLPSVA
jgi:hypothetical protein